jgi:hypothetical protein
MELASIAAEAMPETESHFDMLVCHKGRALAFAQEVAILAAIALTAVW